MDLTPLRDVPAWFARSMVIVALGGLCLLSAKACYADPVARAEAGGVVVTVHTEPCAFKAIVSNLDRRATWQENGKTIEGCVGVSQFGVAMFYFGADKTMFVIPLELFSPVTGA